MNVLQTDYSNLFAAGLRVIESRSTGQGSSSYPVDAISSTDLILSTSEEDFTAPSEVAPNKSSRFPAKLWRHVSWRTDKSSSSANTSALASGAKPPRRRWLSMLPGNVRQETPLDARIWDWSTRVYHATTPLGSVPFRSDRRHHIYCCVPPQRSTRRRGVRRSVPGGQRRSRRHVATHAHSVPRRPAKHRLSALGARLSRLAAQPVRTTTSEIIADALPIPPVLFLPQRDHRPPVGRIEPRRIGHR